MTANDPFDLLGLPASFDLERSAIERAYLARIAAAHPDRAGAPDRGEHAAALNAARHALLHPETRAGVLLDRLEGPSASTCPELPEGFLLEIMDARMGIEQASESGDGAEAERWRRWALDQEAGFVRRAAELFAEPADLRAIRVHLNAWRYIVRLMEQLPAPRSGGP
jgi:curved DNA-binding protein CbpA